MSFSTSVGPRQLSASAPLTRKGYITKGLSGWTVAFWDGKDGIRFLHGLPSFGESLTVLAQLWNSPPDYQNGFPTIVRMHDDR